MVSHAKNLNLLLGQVVLCLGNHHFGNPSGLHICKVNSLLLTDFGKGAVLVEMLGKNLCLGEAD